MKILIPEFVDIVGTVGVGIVIYAYYLLQTERITIKELKYSIMNIVGSLLIIVSLIFNFNFSSFMIESFWVLISCIGVIRHIKSKKETICK